MKIIFTIELTDDGWLCSTEIGKQSFWALNTLKLDSMVSVVMEIEELVQEIITDPDNFGPAFDEVKKLSKHSIPKRNAADFADQLAEDRQMLLSYIREAEWLASSIKRMRIELRELADRFDAIKHGSTAIGNNPSITTVSDTATWDPNSPHTFTSNAK